MKELGRFDPDLEMFVVDKPADPNMDHLRLLRFQAERGDFGPRPLSVPRGDNVFRLSTPEIRRYAMVQADLTPLGVLKGNALLAHIAKTGDY